jgi:small subunit ribosomal protein S7
MKIKAHIKNYKYFLNTSLGKKFVNCLMLGGKKNKAEKFFLESLVLIKLFSNKNPIYLLLLGLKNVKPVVEVRSIRVRGSNYQVPIPLRESRRTLLAIKWIILNARKKKSTTIKNKLKDELILASRKLGESVKKKLTIHRLALTNRAFAHYRWL